MSNSILLNDFNPTQIRYMEPKTNNYGKTMNIISTQTGKSLVIETPLMYTFGIEDGDRNSIRDGQYKIKINFPKVSNSRIDMCKDKIIAFQEEVNDYVFTKNLLGLGLSREEVKNRYKPIFNNNNSDTITTKSAFIKASVPNYNGKFDTLQIYDKDSNIIFPNDKNELPQGLVTQNSRVACCLNFTQLWIKHNKLEWGCSLKLVQCIVIKPTLPVVVVPRQFQLSVEDMADIE